MVYLYEAALIRQKVDPLVGGEHIMKFALRAKAIALI
jgi:hypothetical protein